MLIISLGGNDTPAISRFLAKDNRDAIIFAMNTIDRDLTSVCKSIIDARPNTDIICVSPAAVPTLFTEIKDRDGESEMVILYRDGFLVGHILLRDIQPITEEEGVRQIMAALDIRMPIPHTESTAGDDKLARIKELREYVCRRYPESCCAYNQPAESYRDLVNEVANDFIYMVIGICGCGCRDLTVEAVRDYLEIVRIRHTKKEGGFDKAHELMDEKFGHRDVCSDAVLQFMAYMLDDHGLTDHGSAIGGCWITEEGEVCLEVLNMYLELPDDE